MWYFGWLFIVIVVLCIAGIIYSSRREWWDDYSGTFTSSVICILLTAVIWMGMVVWDKNNEHHRMDNYNEQSIVSDTTYIKSAALNSELSGTFFLGIGHIDSEDVYKFYEIVDSTSFKLTSLEIKSTRICEVNADSTFVPHFVSYYYTEGYMNHSWFYRAMLNEDKKESFYNIHQLKEHVIYVPKGTIVGDLSKLNLK